ncbi:MAG TPA: alpha-amylase family glycosyl hydrolase, partial [Salinimicrobium sp.]|nr:alpha-amylase family glycosyl hydrolase [Salinimicrobium sp.]
MKVPTATYRIQLSPDFSMEELGKNSAYLADLGISTIYSAPFFQSRRGSAHGYDIVDPFSINREIGSLKEFRDLREELGKSNIGWLQDIVPNHMAFDPENNWLHNIFELGPDSKYYRFFDINWKYRK